MRDLPARDNALKNARNEDKSIRISHRAMNPEDFRAEIYAIWRAMCCDQR